MVEEKWDVDGNVFLGELDFVLYLANLKKQAEGLSEEDRKLAREAVLNLKGKDTLSVVWGLCEALDAVCRVIIELVTHRDPEEFIRHIWNLQKEDE